jgi:hypothetical protein
MMSQRRRREVSAGTMGGRKSNSISPSRDVATRARRRFDRYAPVKISSLRAHVHNAFFASFALIRLLLNVRHRRPRY